MTTPTPNERDKHWAGEAADLASQEPEKGWEPMFAHLFASYRQEIEAEKDKRISTLEATLEKAEKAITFRPPWFGNSELVLKGRLDEEALAAIREAKATFPPSTSTSSTDSAAAA